MGKFNYNKLRGRWSEKEQDWQFIYPRSCDGAFLCSVFSGHHTFKEFIDELEARGYDPKTLIVSVERKKA